MSGIDLAVSRNVISPVLPTAVMEITASSCSVIATSTSRHAEMEDGYKAVHQHYGSAVSAQKMTYFSNGDQAGNTAKPSGPLVENRWTNLVKLTCNGTKNLIQNVNGSFSMKKDEGRKRRYTHSTRNANDGFSSKNRSTSEAAIRNGKSLSLKEPDPKSQENQHLSAGESGNRELFSSTSSVHEQSYFNMLKSVGHEQQSSSKLERQNSPVQKRLCSPKQEHQPGPSVQDTPTPAAREQQPSPSKEQQRSLVLQEQRSPSTNQKKTSLTQENQSFPSPTRNKDCPSMQSSTASPARDVDRISGKSQGGSPAPPNDTESRYSRLLAENRWLKRRQLCRLCQRKAVNVTLLPCGHLLYCEDCAQSLSHCGVCQRQILADVKTFLG